jgi:hypothetical protein
MADELLGATAPWLLRFASSLSDRPREGDPVELGRRVTVSSRAG